VEEVLLKVGVLEVKKVLNEDEINIYKDSLKSIWEREKHYWYPLERCNRTDLISFKSSYVDTDEKVEYFINLLKQHSVKMVIEIWENDDGHTFEINNCIVQNAFWRSNDYFWNNEGYWFDDRSDWIIYISHEETITFGGDWIIKEIKSKWSDWKDNLKWDSKNT
jgi:hypothetical protein